MLGASPGDVVTFCDFNRFAELLVDGKTDQPPKTIAALNANATAIALVRTAENDIVEAVRTKQYYTLQQLRDLVRNFNLNGIAGHQIVRLIADLTWTHALTRKRYPSGTPQAEDPAIKRGAEQLEQLKTGSRIFILEGVEETDGNNNVIGIYGGQEKPSAGLLSGSTMHSDVGRPERLWGDHHHHHHWHPDW